MNNSILTRHSDERGTFVELLHNDSGQVSFSTSAPGVTRGGHYHTHKRESFTVIHGEATIRLRYVGSDVITEYNVTGDKPTTVYIPSWYVHNITNTGKSDMYLIIWCSESFDPQDPDTKAERV